MSQYICPVCAYVGLNNDPVQHAWEICPCCLTEFGYDDAGNTHGELRRRFIAGLLAQVEQLKIWNGELAEQLKSVSLSFASARGREDEKQQQIGYLLAKKAAHKAEISDLIGQLTAMQPVVSAVVAVQLVWSAFTKIDAMEFTDKAAKNILAQAAMDADAALGIAVREWRDAETFSLLSRLREVVGGERITLSPRDAEQLIHDIEHPPPANEELRKAFEVYKEVVGKEQSD